MLPLVKQQLRAAATEWSKSTMGSVAMDDCEMLDVITQGSSEEQYYLDVAAQIARFFAHSSVMKAYCGAIPLLWRERAQPQKIYAVEIQEEAARLARTAVEANGFSDRIEVILGDAGNPKALFRNQSLDLVACNPPYQAAGTGPQGAEESRRTARHELRFSLEQLAGTARFALRFGGRLCLCLRPERLAEALSLFRSFGLEPKRLRLVQQRKDKPPSLFLLECRSGGKTGLAVEPVLLLEQDGGGYSDALEKIYGDYRANAGWKNRS